MRTASLAFFLLSFGLAASAQSVVSAHSGVLHYSQGSVLIDGKDINQKFGTFPDIKEGSVLSTQMGLAEVLLTPGVFLRVAANSAVRMISNRLIDTRVELKSGETMVESDDPMKYNAVTVTFGDFLVHIRKACVFSMQSQPAQLKVYHGEAEVEANGESRVVKAGHLLVFGPALVTERFNVKEGDALARWSQLRSEYVSAANLSAAKSLKDSGQNWSSSGWYYNPFYSMYTYIPGSGSFFNPYGYGFWSPYTVYSALPYYYGRGYYGGGYYGGGAVARGGVHQGDTSGNFGRSSNSSFGAANAANTGFGRGSSGSFGSSGSGVAAPAAAPSSSAGSFSSGGAAGGRGGHR